MFYPALRVVYAIGLAAVASGNYAALAEIARLEIAGRDEQKGKLFGSLIPYRVLSGKSLEKHLQTYAPISTWFSQSLKDSFQLALGSQADLDPVVNYYEYLSGLLSADTVPADEGIYPLGRFALRGSRGAMDDVRRQVGAEGTAWPPLVFGLFGGDVPRVEAAIARVDAALVDILPGRGIW